VFYDVHGVYPDLTRRVAAATRTPLIDLHRRSEALVREYGPDRSRALFLHLAPGASPNYPSGLRDDTHFSPLGADEMAALAVDGLRATSLPLAALLRPAPFR